MPFSPTEIGKLYIFVLHHSSANILSPLFSAKGFFVEHKKTKMPTLSPLSTIYVHKMGKNDQNGEFGHSCFPPLNFGLMGPVRFEPLRICIFLIGPRYALNICLHTAAISAGLVLSVFPNLSQDVQCIYLLTTFSPVSLFFSPSVLFNKHSSSELNGR